MTSKAYTKHVQTPGAQTNAAAPKQESPAPKKAGDKPRASAKFRAQVAANNADVGTATTNRATEAKDAGKKANFTNKRWLQSTVAKEGFGKANAPTKEAAGQRVNFKFSVLTADAANPSDAAQKAKPADALPAIHASVASLSSGISALAINNNSPATASLSSSTSAESTVDQTATEVAADEADQDGPEFHLDGEGDEEEAVLSFDSATTSTVPAARPAFS